MSKKLLPAAYDISLSSTEPPDQSASLLPDMSLPVSDTTSIPTPDATDDQVKLEAPPVKPSTATMDEVSELTKRYCEPIDNAKFEPILVDYTIHALHADNLNASRFAADVEWLLREARQHQRDNLALLAKIQVMESTIAANDAKIDKLLSNTMHSATTMPVTSHAKSAKFPDPATFTGSASDTKSFERWELDVNAKLRHNADHFSSEAHKVDYILRLIDGPAARITGTRAMPNAKEPYVTVSDVLDHLRSIYGNTERQRIARSDFQALRMRKTDKFSDFFAEFSYLAGEADITKELLFAELEQRLTPELRLDARHCSGTTIQALADHCNRMDLANRNIARDQSKSNRYSSSAVTPASVAKTAFPPVNANLPPRPRPQYNSAERTALSRAGACFRCRKVGHSAAECPAPSPINALSATISPSPPSPSPSGKGLP